MSVVRIPTNFNIDLEFEIPEFYRRMLAWALDVVLLFFYFKIAAAIYQGIRPGEDAWAIKWLFWLPVFIYHPVCEITMNGQSLGKKIMGLQVVNENGGRPSVSQFLIRWLIRTGDITVVNIILLSVLAFMSRELLAILIGSVLLLATDVVLVMSTKTGQRLGDILAKTILIRTSAKGSIEDTVFVAVADDYVPQFPEIMKLSDRDINAIKRILESSKRRGDAAMAHAAADKIKSYLKISTSLTAFEFLEVLLKDYNYLSTK
ncbi:MAG TPA: RDD family protein [Chitinophagaceae bacterium]|nr:RDD family protein [Chitinophagaceae bacterium]